MSLNGSEAKAMSGGTTERWSNLEVQNAVKVTRSP
jgi:hypothetical protein